MLLHDALDDCQPEAGSFLASGHIRLGQPVTVLHRQADAVVGYIDANLARGFVDFHLDNAL